MSDTNAMLAEAEQFVRHALSHRPNHRLSDDAVHSAALKISKTLSDTFAALEEGGATDPESN